MKGWAVVASSAIPYVKQDAEMPEEVYQSLQELLVSREAQERIALVNAESSFETGSILPADDLGKFAASV